MFAGGEIIFKDSVIRQISHNLALTFVVFLHKTTTFVFVNSYFNSKKEQQWRNF